MSVVRSGLSHAHRSPVVWIPGTPNRFIFVDSAANVIEYDETTETETSAATFLTGTPIANENRALACNTAKTRTAYLATTNSGGADGVELVILDISTLGVVQQNSLIIQTHDANGNGINQAIGIQYHPSSNQFIVLWSGLFRSMGTNFSNLKVAEYDVATDTLGTIIDVESGYSGPPPWYGLIVPDSDEIIYESRKTSTTLRKYNLISQTETGSRNVDTGTLDIGEDYQIFNTNDGLVYEATIEPYPYGVYFSNYTANFSIPSRNGIGITNDSQTFGYGITEKSDGTGFYAHLLYFTGINNDDKFQLWEIDTTGSPYTKTLLAEEIIDFSSLGLNRDGYDYICGSSYKLDNTQNNGDIVFVLNTHALPIVGSGHFIVWSPEFGGSGVSLSIYLSTGGNRVLSAAIDIVEESDLSIYLASQGGRSLAMALDVVNLLRVICFLETTHTFNGVLINPQDETYFLELSGIIIPLIWFTLRKIKNTEGMVDVNLHCNVPTAFYSQLVPLLNGQARLFRRISEYERDMVNGQFAAIDYVHDRLELTVRTTESIPESVTVNIDDVFLVRDIQGLESIRIAPLKSIAIGSHITADTVDMVVEKSVMHISQDAAFLEIS